MDEHVFCVDQLTVSYDKAPVLWDVSLCVPGGRLVGIVGPNGAGKSTLIKSALGLVNPLAGSVRFFGQSLKKVQSRVAYVPQRESVDWQFPITVQELVLMGRYGRLGMLKRPSKADRALAQKYLEVVGLQGYERRQISQLSGGQQQRAFLARALAQEADLYLLDEPFSGVDMSTETTLIEVLKGLRSEGKTVFVVHHGLHNVCDYFDWAILLNLGLVACGPVDEVFTEENLDKAFGKDQALFGEVTQLSQGMSSGVR